jgi:hypothetical protein
VTLANLFSAETQQQMADLYGKPAKPSREAYGKQLRAWNEIADKRHTPAELAAIEADQARRIKVLR